MNVPELSQLVLDPEDMDKVNLQLLVAQHFKEADPIWAAIKVQIGRVLHPFGVHTWVRWLHYDLATDRVIDMNGVICQWCTKARRNR